MLRNRKERKLFRSSPVMVRIVIDRTGIVVHVFAVFITLPTRCNETFEVRKQ